MMALTINFPSVSYFYLWPLQTMISIIYLQQFNLIGFGVKTLAISCFLKVSLSWMPLTSVFSLDAYLGRFWCNTLQISLGINTLSSQTKSFIKGKTLLWSGFSYFPWAVPCIHHYFIFLQICLMTVLAQSILKLFFIKQSSFWLKFGQVAWKTQALCQK